MNPLLFFVAFATLFMLINYYIYKRLIKHLYFSKKMKHLLSLFLFINYLGIILYAVAKYHVAIVNWLFFLASLSIGVLFLLFCTALFYDILRLSLAKIPMSHKRRNFFKKSLDISSIGLASTLSIAATYDARKVVHEKVQIKIKKLKKEYKVAQISDLHIGGLIDQRFIHTIVLRINAMKPDLIVITGDLVDIKVSQANETIDELKKLQSKYGTYFIVGNHEYFHNIQEILNKVKSIGIRVLENENVYIGDKDEGFNLAGVYDIFGYRMKMYKPDIYKALKGIDIDSPSILLAHQPLFIDEVQNGVDLMLSGHTHGGQIYPFKFLVKLQQPYVSGLHQHNDNLQIYVNKGTGFWGPPMRLGASSEITEIDIVGV